MFGLVIAIFVYEFDSWEDGLTYEKDREILKFKDKTWTELVNMAMKDDKMTAWHAKPLRWIIFSSSLAAIFTLIIRHYYKI